MVGRLVLARGVELAGLVDQLTDPQTLARLSDSDRLEVITASVRLDGWSAARRAQTVAALHASVLAEARADTAELNAHAVTAPRAAELAEDDLQDRQLADRRVAMELSLALGVSFATADRELDLALARQLPRRPHRHRPRTTLLARQGPASGCVATNPKEALLRTGCNKAGPSLA